MIELSRATRAMIQALFPQNQWSTVEDLLRRRCGDDLPFVDSSWSKLAERIRFAVLKLSQGDLEALHREIDEAHVDWRDTLMAAGFGHDTSAHRKWKPQEDRRRPPGKPDAG
jgi:hypothetical protein